jgi:hypothetical protein
MKRILLVAVSSSALALAAPAIASAHHHGKHHSGKHAAKHHAARARVLDFRASVPASSALGSPATPATPTTESVGKVTSLKEGVLIITLTDGTPVSGKVTERTEIHCTPATPATGGDDDEAGSGEGDHGSFTKDGPSEGSHGDAHAASTGDDGEDGEHGSDSGQEACTTTALVEGAMVREAELSLGSAGAVWDRVNLL